MRLLLKWKIMATMLLFGLTMLALAVPFVYSSLRLELTLLLMVPIVIVGAVVFSFFLSRGIIRSTEQVKSMSRDIKKGNFSINLDLNASDDELGDMVKDVSEMVKNVSDSLKEIKKAVYSISEGDLTYDLSFEAKGDIAEIMSAFSKMQASLCTLIEDIDKTGNRVASTSQEISSSAEEMNASAQEISSALQQISKGSQTQAEQVEQTASVMKEMSISVADVANRASSAANSASSARNVSEEGRKAVLDSITKMQEIQKVVNDSAEIIGSLGRRSDEIGQIVDVITNISDQTNLLALNAAIEAARAGDQGRGFAVVAEEVKNLAEDSREAAERISQMIKQIRSETESAVDAMERGTKEVAEGMESVNKTGAAFNNIAEITAKTADEIQEISKSSDSQKAGTDMVAMAIDEIANIAEETSSATEESASSTEELTASMEEMAAQAQELSDMALTLQKNVSRFKIGVQTSVPVRKEAKPARKSIQTTGRPLPHNMEKSLQKRGIAVKEV